MANHFERQGVTLVSEHYVILEAGIQTINPVSRAPSRIHCCKTVHALNLSKASIALCEQPPCPCLGCTNGLMTVVYLILIAHTSSDPTSRRSGRWGPRAEALQSADPGGQVGGVLVQLGCTSPPSPSAQRLPDVEGLWQRAAASAFTKEHHSMLQMHKLVLRPHRALPFPTGTLSARCSWLGETAWPSRSLITSYHRLYNTQSSTNHGRRRGKGVCTKYLDLPGFWGLWALVAGTAEGLEMPRWDRLERQEREVAKGATAGIGGMKLGSWFEQRRARDRRGAGGCSNRAW